MSDHNSPADPHHRCDSPRYSNITTAVLEHTDEVWNVRWSHDGEYLAGAGKGESAIIWAVGVSYYLLPSCLSADSEILSPRKNRANGNARNISFCESNTPWDVWRGLWMTRFCSPIRILISRCGTPVYVQSSIHTHSCSHSLRSPVCVYAPSKLIPKR